MKVVVMVLVVESIPIGVLIGSVSVCPMRRRSRFAVRLVGVLIAMLIPALVVALARFGPDTAGPLLLLGFPWGIVLVAFSRPALFHGPGPEPGSSDDDGRGGPGPGDDSPSSPLPLGGLPLPDADPSSMRLRDHRPPRPARGRRQPSRRRERVPPPVRQLFSLKPHSPAG